MGAQPGLQEYNLRPNPREQLLKKQSTPILGPTIIRVGKEEFLTVPHFKMRPDNPEEYERTLLFANAKGEVREVKEKLTIGNASDNDVQVNDQQVAASHAAIKKEGDDFILADSSENGTGWRRVESIDRVAKERVRVPSGGKSEAFVIGSLPAVIRLGDYPLEIMHDRFGDHFIVSEDGKIFYQVKPDEQGLAEITIGSDETSQVRLDDVQVARHHATVQFIGSAIVVEDHTSESGTYIQSGNFSAQDDKRRVLVRATIEAMREAQKKGDLDAVERIRSELSAESMSPEERKTRLETFIQEGLQLMRDGNFASAVSHFENRNAARVLRFKLTFGRGASVSRIPTEEDIGNISHVIAMDSLNETIHEGEIGNIKMGTIRIEESLPDNVKQALNHEVALVHAEEWVHALQSLKGPLAGVEDHEIDVLAYYLQHGVPVTQNFIYRHDRYEWYQNQQQIDNASS